VFDGQVTPGDIIERADGGGYDAVDSTRESHRHVGDAHRREPREG
jgi:hypothetical protein